MAHMKRLMGSFPTSTGYSLGGFPPPVCADQQMDEKRRMKDRKRSQGWQFNAAWRCDDCGVRRLGRNIVERRCPCPARCVTGFSIQSGARQKKKNSYKPAWRRPLSEPDSSFRGAVFLPHEIIIETPDACAGSGRTRKKKVSDPSIQPLEVSGGQAKQLAA